MSDSFQKLRAKLSELFQLEAAAELDFGIYRILNARRVEVEGFLDSLQPQVDAILTETLQTGSAELKVELEKVESGLRAGGFDEAMIATAPKVRELREKITAAGGDSTALSHDIFSHLTTFFSRYYKDGDFLSLRRYKRDTYAIPYEGEEVKLHWANADQYYIKSAENFRDYTFKLATKDDAPRVTFKLVEADSQKDDTKATAGQERRFVYQGIIESPDAGLLILGFSYLPMGKDKKQVEFNKQAIADILRDAAKGSFVPLASPDKTYTGKRKEGRTVLEKHLTDYTARNTFDYFIHKDLGGFLRRELDFYIKNEVLYLDDLDDAPETNWRETRARLKALRTIAGKVIRFLAQIEDFQKKLWLKKKFVTGCDYVVTLDRIPEELYPEIAACDAQREEWVKLFAIDQIEADSGRTSYSVPLTVEFLRENKGLPVDTRQLGAATSNRVCEESLGWDGLAVKSENLQGLHFLKNQTRGMVQCIYIDPPYNTGVDGFVYKDSFKSSTWVAMIHDRVGVGAQLLGNLGVMFASINEIQRDELAMVLRSVFGQQNRIEELIWVRDTVSNNAPTYSTNHEYIEVFARNRLGVEAVKSMFRDERPGFREVTELVALLGGEFAEPSVIEKSIAELYSQHRREHAASAKEKGMSPKEAKTSDEWKGIYPYRFVEYRSADGRFVEASAARECNAAPWIWRPVEPSMPSGKQADSTKNPASPNYRFYRPPHPDTGNTCKAPKRGWSFPFHPLDGRASFDSYVADDRIAFPASEKQIPQQKYFLHEVETIVSTSVVRQYADGEPQLEALLGCKGMVENPKPPALVSKLVRQTTSSGAVVLDFFAGSGTTGHAVINLNREDDGNRKYILIEMGEHFDTALVPRLKKVVYSKDWKDGKPQSRNTGISHCFKVLRLESYEDTLNNLRLHRSRDQELALEAMSATAREEYQLGYMLDLESAGSQSLLNVTAFTDPFGYTLDVATGTAGETKPVKVDLVETFNWLVGLTVVAQGTGGGVTWMEGANPEGERVLILWRNTKEVDADALNAWCKKQKISVLDGEFSLIYVNGDHHLENLRREDQTWKVRLIDEEFPRLMWEGC